MILEESSDISIFRIITNSFPTLLQLRFTARSKEAENCYFHRSFAILEICQRYYDEKLSIRG